MNAKIIYTTIELLKKKNIIFEKGLTNEEYHVIKSMFGILFPYDLRCFLQMALPISTGFVNWRLALHDKTERECINKRLSWPLEGILFDVKNNVFWDNEWGKKSNSDEDQKRIVEQYYRRYPTLIPVYSHRYIPSQPIEEGNPVFSVYQTDIMYYGNDLVSYFCNEFNIKLLDHKISKIPKYIEFWGRNATQ